MQRDVVSPADGGVDSLGKARQGEARQRKAVESLAPLSQSTCLLGMLSMVPLVLPCPVQLLIHRELEYGSSPKREA